MNIEDLVSSSILSIGKDVFNIGAFHREEKSKIILKQNWTSKRGRIFHITYEVPDIYAVTANHKFISIGYYFTNNIFCFGRIRLNFQRKSFGLLCDHFNNYFKVIKEDLWRTQDPNINIRINYGDQFSESDIEFYDLRLLPDQFKAELKIYD